MNKKKILWIEDDATELMGLVKPLEKDGHKIVVAEDEIKALEIIDKFNFDLILFDIIIPSGIKGNIGNEYFVGLRLLRKLIFEMNIKTPIIVLSVVRDQEMINEISNLGVKKILQKGAFLPSKLKEEINDTLFENNC